MNWKKEVLVHIKPTREEEKEVAVQISDFLKRLNKVMGDARAVLGGSGAKGTWLRDQHDADVFVLFPHAKYHKNSDELADILDKRLKKAFKRYTRLHGSRDYFQIRENGATFEIIPILGIGQARQAANITDVSPLHAQWVKKNSTEKLRDDIRLAKAFCKTQNCYGAESYIRGLSGYVLEILVIQYKGFEKLLRAALRWEEKQVIDAARFYPHKENVWVVMNKAKLESPLIVVDPVDGARNAAAALNKEKWLLFREKAGLFLKRPSVHFFTREEVTLDKLRSKKGKNHLLWMEVESILGKEDVSGTRLLLAFEFLRKNLTVFDVVKDGWEWNKKKKGVFWFFLKKKELSRFELRRGPPLEMKKYVEDFKKTHTKTFVKDGFIWTKVVVKDYSLKNFLKRRIKEGYFVEKVKAVKRMVVL